MAINTDAVQRLYVAYFNRPADPGGLAYWEGLLPSTTTTQAQLAAIASGFSGSAEYAMLYGSLPNTVMVNSLYLNLFGRAAEPAGLTHWAGRLTAGSETFASLALQLTYSAQGTDATAIANKVTAANAFTAALDNNAEIFSYSGTAAAAFARMWLAPVTDSTASLATAVATVDAAVVHIVARTATSATTLAAADATVPHTLVADTTHTGGAGANDITLVGIDTTAAGFDILPLA